MAPAQPGGRSTAAETDEDDPQQRQATWAIAHMTRLEKMVWNFLGKADGPWGFAPQVVKGPYVLDFYSQKYLLAVEADGPSHLKSAEADRKRDDYLAKQGIVTLRLTRSDFVRSQPQQLYAMMEAIIHPSNAIVIATDKRGKP
jgi:very-short-patch-repair endonuclease